VDFYTKNKRSERNHYDPRIPPGGGSAVLVPVGCGRLPREVDRLCRGGGGRAGGGEDGSGGTLVATGVKNPGADVSAHRGSGRRTFSGASWNGSGWVTRIGDEGESVTMAWVVRSGAVVAGGDCG
jgi:hypothetical protein